MAKLAALVIAMAIWFVIKRQMTNHGDTGGAGGGSASISIPYLQIRDGIRAEAVIQEPQLVVQEPYWHLCGDFSAQVLLLSV